MPLPRHRICKYCLLTLLTVGLVSSAAAVPVNPQDPPPSSSDVEAVDRGRLTYGFYCMNCHGGDGRGGRDGGSDLTESEMLKADDGGREFAEFLPVGRPEQRMPPTPLAEGEIADLWAFLRVLVGAEDTGASASTSGDAEAGARQFKASGCASCHSVTRDLQGIGGRLEPAAIHQRMLTLPSPGKAAPDERRRHAESVKKLDAQTMRDIAAYLATLR
jgi:cytochrome c oxidase cbb3-type subunit III